MTFSSLEQIPNYLRPIFKEIVVIIERTFVYLINETMKIGNSTDSSNDLSFFPNLPKNKTARHLTNGKGKQFAQRNLLAILLYCQE